MRCQPTASHDIAGKPFEDLTGAVLDSVYPATGEVIARLHAASDTTVDRAVQAATAAQKGWAAMPGRDRGRVLRRAADLIRARNRELSELETLDTGKALQ